jgi:hypothetical protein
MTHKVIKLFFLAVILALSTNSLAFAATQKEECETSGGVWSTRYVGSTLQSDCLTQAESCKVANGKLESKYVGSSLQTICVTTGTPSSKPDCSAIGGVWDDSKSATKQCSKDYGTSGLGQAADDSVVAPAGALAVEYDKPNGAKSCKADKGTKLTSENCGIVELLDTIFAAVSGLVIIAIIANMIVGGIQYSLSQGDSGAAVKARKRIQDGVMAFLLYISLYGFIQWLIPGGIF